MRVAIVHDWFPAFRGGERVVAEICRLYPDADIYTLFNFLPQAEQEKHFGTARFHCSPANKLPFVQKYYKTLFPICPFLIEQFDVTRYDLILSSSAAFSRGVITRPDQPHLCYVHSPLRYVWDQQFEYIDQARLGYGPKGLLFRWLAHRLRIWDVRTAHSPDVMLANSTYVQSRIRRVYGRPSEVVFPPVAVEETTFNSNKDDYYVVASYLVPYKRVDIVVEAFNRMPTKKLIVIGEGEQERRLRAMASPNITFLGFLPRQELLRKIANAKAFVFAGCEDFGIVMAEAQASGTPLIAYGRGGARDIVRVHPAHSRTEILFTEQDADCLREAILEFEKEQSTILPSACRENAMRFTAEHFRKGVLAGVARIQNEPTTPRSTMRLA